MLRQKHPGIYKIVHVPTGKYYIGKSTDVPTRWKSHLTDLLFKRHGNEEMQQLFSETHYTDFTFQILKLCKLKEVAQLEKDTIRLEVEKLESLNLSHLLLNVDGNPFKKKRNKVGQKTKNAILTTEDEKGEPNGKPVRKNRNKVTKN